ncbi:MAG TPA: SCO family protein [Steroidobacteraceae bacterium]|jgi:protein SCO1/2|nr:SCO family protein [Steroidobacteraceae bacterium]
MILGVLMICGALAARAADGDPPQSLYHLDATLIDQSGQRQGLDVWRGHPVLVTMFYGSCQATCPMIIDTLRATERAVSADQRAGLRVLMISFDPQRDTPAALRAIAEERRIDGTRWTLAHADASTVRTIAALLNIQYRQLPSGEFNHSTVISLLSPVGEIEATTSALGHADSGLIAQLRK